MRYRVLFNKGKNIILKYLSSNSLKKINYQTTSFSWTGRINYILKHNIISDFNEIKKRAQDIWTQPESTRLPALEMIDNPANREMIIQYGVFKKKKSINLLSATTEDVFFIKNIPQGFEHSNLIKFAFPDSVEKGMFDVDIYVIQLATQNPQNTLFYNVAPNDIIGELMRQWGIFIQDLSEKENQLKIIYQREYDNIKGFTRQAFTKGLKDRIHNIAVDTLNSINKDTSSQYGIEKKTGVIPSEKEYIFFKKLLDLSTNIYKELDSLNESYNQFGLSPNSQKTPINNSGDIRNYIPLSGGSKNIQSRKNNKIKRRYNKKSSKNNRN